MQSIKREDKSVEWQLAWTNPLTQRNEQLSLEHPLAFGRQFIEMPGVINGELVVRRVVPLPEIAPYHCIVIPDNFGLLLVDHSKGQTRVNGFPCETSQLSAGDRISMGTVELEVLRTSKTGTLGSTQPPQTTKPEKQKQKSQNKYKSGCDREVGFLFKRRCGRTDPSGCFDCGGGRYQQDPHYDPYRNDYAYYYRGFGNYHRGSWGSNYYYQRDSFYYDASNRSVAFTDADANAFEEEIDSDYQGYDEYESSFEAS